MGSNRQKVREVVFDVLASVLNLQPFDVAVAADFESQR